MISQRDVMAFFNIIDVLSNPEKAKQELKMLQERAEGIVEKEQNLQSHAIEVNNKAIEAARVLSTQESYNNIHEARTSLLNDREAKLADRANSQKILEAQQQARENRLNEVANSQAQTEAVLLERLEKLEQRELRVNERENAVRLKEADYSERVKKLRSAVG